MPRQDAGQDEDVQRLNTSCEHGFTVPHEADGRWCVPELTQLMKESMMPKDSPEKEPAALQDAPPEVLRALREQRATAPPTHPHRYQLAYNTLQSRLLAILSSPDSRSDLEWRKVLIDALSVASTKVL